MFCRVIFLTFTFALELLFIFLIVGIFQSKFFEKTLFNIAQQPWGIITHVTKYALN